MSESSSAPPPPPNNMTAERGDPEAKSDYSSVERMVRMEWPKRGCDCLNTQGPYPDEVEGI
jgi:hypothetical protein